MKEGTFLMNLKQCIRLDHVGTTSPQIELLIAANNAGKFFSGLTFQLKYELYEDTFRMVGSGKTKCKVHQSLITSLLVQSGEIADLWNLDAIGVNEHVVVTLNKIKSKLHCIISRIMPMMEGMKLVFLGRK